MEMFADLVLLSSVVFVPAAQLLAHPLQLEFMPFTLHACRAISETLSMSMPVCRVVMSPAPIYPRKSSRRDLIDIDQTTHYIHSHFPI